MTELPSEDFLSELRERAQRYGHDGDWPAVNDFVRAMYQLANLPIPVIEPDPIEDEPA